MITRPPFWRAIVGTGFEPATFDEYVQTVEMGGWKPSMIVLHNTAEPMLRDWHKVAGSIRMLNLEHYYRDFMGWTAGPHLFVADDQIWVFTPLNFPGVHSPSWNKISWGVEIVGNYMVEQFQGTKAKDNTVIALSALCRKQGIDPAVNLKLHHEDPRTAHHGCPGSNVLKDDVIKLVQEALHA